jgi:hypothetical protein
MTYITARLPKLEELKEELKDPKNLERYLKYMGFEGPDGTIEYLESKIKEYSDTKKSNK